MSEATYRKVKLDGEEHVLKMDFNAISEIENYFDKGIFSVVEEETIGFNTTRIFIWASMLWKNPKIKPHHVGSMIEKELEENEEFDLQELMKLSTMVLTESKAFKILVKRAQKATEEEKETKNEITA